MRVINAAIYLFSQFDVMIFCEYFSLCHYVKMTGVFPKNTILTIQEFICIKRHLSFQVTNLQDVL